MKETRPKWFVNSLMNIRRKIETVIGQLTDRFKIQSIKAKDIWHLLSKVRRKLCSHTVSFFLTGNIQFDSILS